MQLLIVILQDKQVKWQTINNKNNNIKKFKKNKNKLKKLKIKISLFRINI